jgi:hypothetical protein
MIDILKTKVILEGPEVEVMIEELIDERGLIIVILGILIAIHIKCFD